MRHSQNDVVGLAILEKLEAFRCKLIWFFFAHTPRQ